MELFAVFEEACEKVRQAGQKIRHADPKDGMKEKEGAFNFVTKYDTMVQEFLIRELGALLPEAGFVGEEGDCKKEKLSEGYVFIIDPIDGTTNFICGFPCSAISVALAVQGEVQFGIVYNPFREELFSAFRGKGAFLNGKRLTLSETKLEDGVACMDISPYNFELRDQTMEMAKKISYHCMDLRDIGSAALSICYIAAGRCNAYYSLKLCVWDYAAAALVLEEAGGRILKKDGERLRLETGVAVLAGAKGVLEKVLEVLGE